jgi:hypothetical protein
MLQPAVEVGERAEHEQKTCSEDLLKK